MRYASLPGPIQDSNGFPSILDRYEEIDFWVLCPSHPEATQGIEPRRTFVMTTAFSPPYLTASRSEPEKSSLQAGCRHADGPHANDPQAPSQESTDPEADQANHDGSRDRQGHDKLVKEDRKSTRLNSSHSSISYAV